MGTLHYILEVQFLIGSKKFVMKLSLHATDYRTLGIAVAYNEFFLKGRDKLHWKAN